MIASPRSQVRFAVTATGPEGGAVPVAFRVTYSHGADDVVRTAMILPHQRHRFVREYGHEDGWRVQFEPLLELPEELLLAWAHAGLREWVSKDHLRQFDEIAVRAIMAHRNPEEN